MTIMKKLFYFMSLMLCMMFGSMTFVSCGDDDDKSTSGGGADTSVTARDLIGCWYGVDEKSSEKINVFVMNFTTTTEGNYMEYKAKSKNNWAIETDNQMTFTWTLVNGVMTAQLYSGGSKVGVMMGEIVKKISDNQIRVKRYLNEQGTKTDIVDIIRIDNPQQAQAVLRELLDGNGNGGDDNGGPDASVTAQDLYGTWYGVDENSSERVSVFLMEFSENGEGYYSDIKAKAKNNWEPEFSDPMSMKWSLDKGIMTAKLYQDGRDHTLKGEILQKISNNQLRVKRYFDENGTEYDIVDLNRAESEQQVAQYLMQLIAQKIK
jgi:glutaredoxin